jgi:hypothetical protein
MERSNNMRLKDVKVGDKFQSVVYGRICKVTGTITKIGTVNIQFSSDYMGRTLEGIKIPKRALVGGYVVREDTLFDVIESN